MGLYQKGDLGKPSQSDRKEISSREATVTKYKADLRQKEAARKRQQIFCVNQKRKTQANAEDTGAKLSKKSHEKEKHVNKEDLIAAICRIAISGSARTAISY